MNEFESFKNDIKSVFEKYNYEFDDINVNIETINRNELKKSNTLVDKRINNINEEYQKRLDNNILISNIFNDFKEFFDSIQMIIF